MTVDGPLRESRLDGGIRLVIVESPDLAAPLVGALDAADVGAWVWVEAESCLYWSPRVADLLAFDLSSSHDVLGRFVNAVHAEDRPPVRDLIAGTVVEDNFELRFRFLGRDGHYRWICMRGRVERDASGTLQRQGGTVRDISAEVAREEERAEAAARLEALVNAMPFAVWGYSGRSGAELRVTHQNAKSMAWRGNRIGFGLDDMPPHIARVWRADMADVLAGRIIRGRTEDEVPGRVIDRIVAPVEVNGAITGVVGISIDVTAEERARRFEALLTDATAEFASRSADTLDAALSTALERIGRFLGVALSCLGEVSDDGWMSITHWWADPDRQHPSFETEVDAASLTGVLDLLKANQPVIVRSPREFSEGSPERRFLEARELESFVLVPARQSDGTLVVLGLAGGPGQQIDWPADTVALMRLAGTLLAGMLARVRAEANQRLVERRMQEAHKLESLGVLAGGIAHDFNNLLTAILGNASLLRVDYSEVDAISGPLEQIEAASRRAADLCRQMLAYAGRGRFALQLLDLNDVVRQSQARLRVSIPRKSALELSLAPDLPPVLADQVQIHQLLMNLLINAGEAIGDREGTITITTGTTRRSARELADTVFSPQLSDGEYVCLSVKDTGEGMTPDTVSRIFDPFFTTKFTGRGLGLAAVVGIVRAHKGALRVASQPGDGSTFELLFPVQPGVSAPSSPSRATRRGGKSAWRSTGTVLVVDDESGVRELARAVLERAGLTVVVAEDGHQGVDAFRAMADSVRLVLVDLTMPGLDGRRALEAMRQMRPDVRAVLMSGYTRDDVTKTSAHVFLRKPFTPAALRNAVRKALGE